MFEKMRKNTVQVARPKPIVIHGIEVKKQPVGKYFEMLDRTGGIIAELLDAAFPGMKPNEIIASLSTITSEELKSLFVRLLGIVPRKLVGILAEIVDAAGNPNWELLTPAEMLEVCKKFWELNDLSSFFANARSAIQQMGRQNQMTDIGSKN